MQTHLNCQNPWFRKYLEFGQALARCSKGLFPVSHVPDFGPSDLHALLRGHTQAVLDLVDEPERASLLLKHLGELSCLYTQEYWRHIPLFQSGYFAAPYCLWSPGPILHMQEDAAAAYSPKLYRNLLQPVDRRLAGLFSCAYIHLHSTSMHLLDAILEIEELRCFEINNDATGPPVEAILPSGGSRKRSDPC